ncbi:MAG: hypothetical protein E5W60_23425, partial [Mesorhizobium sp.]
ARKYGAAEQTRPFVIPGRSRSEATSRRPWNPCRNFEVLLLSRILLRRSSPAVAACAAIKADKHILLEKPACLTVREIDELLALSKDYARTIFVGYMRRYAPAYLAAREELPTHADITHVRIFDLISEGRHFLKKSQNTLYPTDIDPA